MAYGVGPELKPQYHKKRKKEQSGLAYFSMVPFPLHLKET
jgi:hypothetical protein